jgi:hypothetical protein
LLHLEGNYQKWPFHYSPNPLSLCLCHMVQIYTLMPLNDFYLWGFELSYKANWLPLRFLLRNNQEIKIFHQEIKSQLKSQVTRCLWKMLEFLVYLFQSLFWPWQRFKSQLYWPYNKIIYNN